MMTREQFLLGKLAEEAGEIAQIAIKTQHYGLKLCHPKTNKQNSDEIIYEINDLYAVVSMLRDECGLDFNYFINHTHIANKKLAIEKGYKIAKREGRVS